MFSDKSLFQIPSSSDIPGTAWNVRDDGGRTGKVQSVQDEDYMPNQQIWSFIQLAEKKKAKSVFLDK